MSGENENTQKGTEQKDEGGQKTSVPIDVYENVKGDMLAYKDRMRKAEAALEQHEKEKSESEKQRLEKEKQFESLYAQEKAKSEQTEARLRRTQVLAELRTEAMAMKIRNAKDANLEILVDAVKFENGEPVGVKELLENLKKEKDYLFDTNPTALGTVTRKPGAKPKESLTFEDLQKDTAEMSRLMKEDRASYDRLKKEYLAKRGRH